MNKLKTFWNNYFVAQLALFFLIYHILYTLRIHFFNLHKKCIALLIAFHTWSMSLNRWCSGIGNTFQYFLWNVWPCRCDNNRWIQVWFQLASTSSQVTTTRPCVMANRVPFLPKPTFKTAKSLDYYLHSSKIKKKTVLNCCNSHSLRETIAVFVVWLEWIHMTHNVHPVLSSHDVLDADASVHYECFRWIFSLCLALDLQKTNTEMCVLIKTFLQSTAQFALHHNTLEQLRKKTNPICMYQPLESFYWKQIISLWCSFCRMHENVIKLHC